MVPTASHAGSYGRLPEDFAEWRQGLTYTVRPGLLHPVPADVERRLNVTVRHVAEHGAPPGSFADLYQRASRLLDARTGRLRGLDPAVELRTWILAQAWFMNEMGSTCVYSAALTRGVMFASDPAVVPQGEPPPSRADFEGPSPGTPEAFAARHVDDEGPRRLDEIYVDFAHAEPETDITLSYGEYVAAPDTPDFPSIVDRAHRLAAFYHETCGWSDDRGKTPHQILRGDWNCLSTGKTVDPFIATVHLYFRI